MVAQPSGWEHRHRSQSARTRRIGQCEVGAVKEVEKLGAELFGARRSQFGKIIIIVGSSISWPDCAVRLRRAFCTLPFSGRECDLSLPFDGSGGALGTDIIRRSGRRFVDRYRDSLTWPQVKMLRAIERCRTAALGGHRDQCDRCGHQTTFFNSCRNRHCPKCQTNAREKWLFARQQELLPAGYYHLVFSVPHALVPLIWQNKRVLFQLLFEASAATLLEVAADQRHLGAEIGFLSVLHTWGQTLQPHPHVHCVVPGGGLSLDHLRWIRSRNHFFLPVNVLSKVFRGKFVAAIFRASALRVCSLLFQCDRSRTGWCSLVHGRRDSEHPPDHDGRRRNPVPVARRGLSRWHHSGTGRCYLVHRCLPEQCGKTNDFRIFGTVPCPKRPQPAVGYHNRTGRRVVV